MTSLQMSPINDIFISGAPDDTIRLWDLRSPNCQGVVAINGNPLIAYDPQGVIFAVALENRFVRLFDTKSYERGPFACFEIIDNNQRISRWTSLQFSPDGKELMIGTNGGAIYLIDSFDGYVKHCLTGNQNSSALDLIPSFSPDAQYVICGGQDGRIHIWSRENGKIIANLEGHSTYPQLVKFNPKYNMMASACSNLALWLPSE